MTIHRFALLPLALALIATGCGKSAGPAGGQSGPVEAPRHPQGTGTANVTWQPNVHVMEQVEGLAGLISVSSDGSTLVFDRGLADVPAMKDGDVLLIKGALARKIIASETSGNEFAVLTEPAGLPDLVSDATIRLRAPVRFGAGTALAAAAPEATIWHKVAGALVPSAHAQSPTEERRKSAEKNGRRDAFGNVAKAPYKALLEGWETEFSATPSTGRVDISLQLKKSAAGVAAVVSGNGHLSDFDFDADIDVRKSIVEKMQVNYRSLNGVMNFKWDVQTTDDGSLRGNVGMKLPAAIEIPLYQYLGGLPLFLEISSAVLIKPGIGSEYSFSHGEFRATYDGYQGFSAKQGVVDADGKVTGDLKLVDSAGGSGPATGIVLAFAAPRLELKMGLEKVTKFEGIKEGAAKADQYFDKLVDKAFGAEALARFKQSPMSKVTGKGIVDAAMGSDAAAYIQLVTTSGMSHSGTAAMVPCTRTDLHMAVKVGTSAHAMGQSVGNAEKEIYKKDLTRVFPSENALCAGI